MGGKHSRDKGNRGEREFAELIGGKRVPLSGAVEGYDNDVIGMGLRWEVKRRKSGFKTLTTWLRGNENEAPPDALALRDDRGPWIVAMTLERFKEMVK